MNNEEKNIVFTADDIEKYFEGRLLPQQMHALEKAALNDPFLADAEGDLGFVPGSDTAKIYIKNLLTNKEDSMNFPDLSAAGKSNFKATIELGLLNVLGGRNLPTNQRPYVDTLHFEVYVTDFAKNKSNLVVTTEPFYYFSLP